MKSLTLFMAFLLWSGTAHSKEHDRFSDQYVAGELIGLTYSELGARLDLKPTNSPQPWNELRWEDGRVVGLTPMSIAANDRAKCKSPASTSFTHEQQWVTAAFIDERLSHFEVGGGLKFASTGGQLSYASDSKGRTLPSDASLTLSCHSRGRMWPLAVLAAPLIPIALVFDPERGKRREIRQRFAEFAKLEIGKPPPGGLETYAAEAQRAMVTVRTHGPSEAIIEFGWPDKPNRMPLATAEVQQGIVVRLSAPTDLQGCERTRAGSLSCWD